MSSKVQAVVNEFVGKGFVFSAYDVTKTLRNRNPHVNIRHEETKDEIYAMDLSGQCYTHDYCHVYGFNLFSHSSDATADQRYDIDWVENNPTQSGIAFDLSSLPTTITPTPAGIVQPSIPTPSTTSTVTDDEEDEDEDDSDVLKTTAAGRLNISGKLLNVIGCTTCVSLEKDEDDDGPFIRILRSTPNEELNYYFRDNGRIRINKRTLTKAFGKGKTKFKIAQSPCSLELRPA